MKIACAQIDCEVGNVRKNIDNVREFALCARESGCEMVVFPELIDTGCGVSNVRKYASTWDRWPFLELCSIAEEFRLVLVCGISEISGRSLYNSVAVVGPDGRLIARYRKIHLITAEPFCEHQIFTAGDSFCLFSYGGVNFGVMVCYDLRFPEAARYYALRDASVILTPSAWPFSRLKHWKTLIEARAIENQIYMVCSNRVGRDGELDFGGSSCIVDPWGELLAFAPETGEKLIVGEIDMNRLMEIRNFMPTLQSRRPELYSF